MGDIRRFISNVPDTAKVLVAVDGGFSYARTLYLDPIEAFGDNALMISDD